MVQKSSTDRENLRKFQLVLYVMFGLDDGSGQQVEEAIEMVEIGAEIRQEHIEERSPLNAGTTNSE